MSDIGALLELSGRTALVTGGGSGIGQASALLLASAGASVLALDVNLAGLEDTAREAIGLRGSIEPLVLDVSDRARVGAALGGRAFDIVLNAAGIIVRKDLAATEPEDWDRVLAVNLTGYFNILKAVLPEMRTGGSVIQIASMTAHAGNRYPAYTATKGGILAMTRELAAELGPRRIRVNSISPGVIVTNINREHYMAAGHGDGAVALTPLARLGETEDVARAVLFLASDMSSFVSGADLRVDGGLTTTRVI